LYAVDVDVIFGTLDKSKVRHDKQAFLFFCSGGWARTAPNGRARGFADIKGPVGHFAVLRTGWVEDPKYIVPPNERTQVLLG
jgi:hypothetical protein